MTYLNWMFNMTFHLVFHIVYKRKRRLSEKCFNIHTNTSSFTFSASLNLSFHMPLFPFIREKGGYLKSDLMSSQKKLQKDTQTPHLPYFMLTQMNPLNLISEHEKQITGNG